jgi:hypothetical protein
MSQLPYDVKVENALKRAREAETSKEIVRPLNSPRSGSMDIDHIIGTITEDDCVLQPPIN